MKLIRFELTKDYILSKVSEEAIFCEYLEIKSVDFTKHYINVLRQDDIPKCSFFVRHTDNRLIFNDFAWRQFDCFDVVKQKYNVSFFRALEIVAERFNLLENVIPYDSSKKVILSVKAKYSIRIKRKKFSKWDLAFWNIGGLNISYETLQYYNIFSIECFWEYVDNEQRFYNNLKQTFAYHFPDDTDEYKYQIYSPNKRKDQRRFINPSGIKFGDLEYLDRTQDYVIITKSKKDAFYQKLFGLNTCFIIHEKIRPSDIIIHILAKMGKVFNTQIKIFTLFDNDWTGMRQSVVYKQAGCIPLLFPKQEGKDFTEFLTKFGKETVIETIEYYKQQLL